MEGIGINGGQFIVDLVCSIILIAIGCKVWPKLLRALYARRAAIIKIHEDATAAEEKLAKADSEVKTILAEAQKQARDIVAEAQTQAEQIIKKNETQAKLREQQILAEAQKQGEVLLNTILLRAKHHIAKFAIHMAQKIIGETLVDQAKAYAVVADFFTRMPSEVQNLSPEVEVTSALLLDDRERKKILTHFPPPIHVTFKVDPEILGGLSIKSGKILADGSLRRQLRNISAL